MGINMDRDSFNNLINENLIPIIKNEMDYLKDRNNEFQISSPLLNKHNEKKAFGDLYFLFDKHKLQCKDYLGEHSVKLDRHKLATVLMLSVADFAPIKVYSSYKTRNISEELMLANYRIAFRFACAYAVKALYVSFRDKSTNPDHCEDYNEQEKYVVAAQILKDNGAPLFPKTRKDLPTYIESYVKILYKQYQENLYSDFIPYALFSDTFYWIDVYNKMQLGIKIENLDIDILKRK